MGMVKSWRMIPGFEGWLMAVGDGGLISGFGTRRFFFFFFFFFGYNWEILSSLTLGVLARYEGVNICT